MTDSTCKTMSLPLYSVYGFSHPHSSKLTAYLGSNPVTVMVDYTATHNFISDKLVRSLRLPMFDTDAFSVYLGDGQVVSSHGLCQNLDLHFDGSSVLIDGQNLDLRCNGSSVVINAYMLGMDGVDLILNCTAPAETKVYWRKMAELLVNRNFKEFPMMVGSSLTLVRSYASPLQPKMSELLVNQNFKELRTMADSGLTLVRSYVSPLQPKMSDLLVNRNFKELRTVADSSLTLVRSSASLFLPTIRDWKDASVFFSGVVLGILLFYFLEYLWVD